MATSKKRGIKSSAQDNFLEPNAVTSLTATDVGTNRPYLATANTTSAASAAGTGAAASLSWTLPAASPPATSYTITTTPSTYTATTGNSNTTYTFEGLASNTSYTFTVVATNNAGSSQATTSPSVTVTTVPAAPAAPTATSSVADQDVVSWTAPVNGGKAITGYDWECNDGKTGSTASTSATVTQEGAGSSTNAYRVRAKNANGNGQYSAYGNAVDTVAPFFPYFPFFPPFFPFFPPYFPFFPPYFPYFPFFPPFFPFFPPFFPFFPPSFGPFFPPYFKGFAPFFPFFPFFPPYFACIDQDTLIAVYGQSGQIEYKMAKEVQVGDEVVGVNWNGLPSEQDEDPLMSTFDKLDGIRYEKTTVISILPSEKPTTMYINGNSDKRFSLQQTILVKRNNVWMFITTGALEIGDIIVETSGNEFSEIEITSIDIVDEVRMVYQFDTNPVDTLIAGDIVVHNSKFLF